MTKEETRQLAIEFERRIQIMYPNEEFAEKIDTDTIYSILNEYQIKYIKQQYIMLDQQQMLNTAKAKLHLTLRTLLETKKITRAIRQSGDRTHVSFELPNDFLFYVRSSSIVDKTYIDKHEKTSFTTIGNILMDPISANAVLDNAFDDNRIIRTPIAIIDGAHTDKIQIVHDIYTHVDALQLTYYRMPHTFNIINVDNKTTFDNCELPVDCFDELIDGAIQLYIMLYKFGLSLAATDKGDRALKRGLKNLTNDDKEANT